MVLWFASPTLLALALDLVLRGRAMAAYSPLDRLNYFGSTLASAGFWCGPLWLSSQLFLVTGGRRRALARAGLAVFYAAWVLPFAVFCFGGQALYHAVFHAYMARDTVRLGIALRGTLGDWLASWGGSYALLAMLAPGVLITLGIALVTRRAAPLVARAAYVVPVVAFTSAMVCFWIDFVESRSLQAAPPDTCFVHGVVHAARDGVTGKGWVRRGISLRTPAPLPPLPRAAHRPNVLVILTESVRADALCSDPASGCRAPLLDEVMPDRAPLGRLTTQSPGTFSACMMLWTGLPPSADFATAHRAPVLWEIARAVGYRTAYVTSQNLRYDDFGAFVKNAGIDVKLSAMELGATIDAQIGAPDERAAQAMLDFVRAAPDGAPYFGLLHFSNTHAPYRVDPALQPFSPHSDNPLGDVTQFHNHYLNSVRLQERTLAGFLRALRALPSYEDTVVVFLSDHGEQFREHGGLYHIHSLYDEELRVPGWIAAGPRGLGEGARAAIRSYAARRTYSQDVQATVVDLLGALDARPSMPFAELTTGRSLVRAASPDEPTAVLSTTTGVWEADDPKYGVMRGERLLAFSPGSPFTCFDIAKDPRELSPESPALCGPMLAAARRAFPGLAPK